MVSQKEYERIYEEKRKDNLFWSVLWIVTFILLIITFNKMLSYVQENQELKEQVEKQQLTFKIEYTCDYGWMNETIIKYFDDYNVYKTDLELIKSYNLEGYNCEVKT